MVTFAFTIGGRSGSLTAHEDEFFMLLQRKEFLFGKSGYWPENPGQ